MERLSMILIMMILSSMFPAFNTAPWMAQPGETNNATPHNLTPALELLGTEYYRNTSSVGELLNLTLEGLSGFASTVSNDSQYRDLMRFLAGLNIYESTRIALIETKEYYIAGKDVEDIAYDPFTGFDKRWAPMTAKTEDGRLDVGFFVGTCGVYRPLNPVYGFEQYHFLSRVFDRGAYLLNGTYVPYRCNWTIDESPGKVPEDAVVYNQTLGWINPHAGEEYEVAITYRCGFGEWHNGMERSLEDTKNFIAFLYTWTYRDFPGDGYYEERIGLEDVLSNVLGFRFDGKGYTVYLKSREPLVSDLLAERYLFYPSMPWELYWAMGELVANEYHYGIYNTNYVFIPEHESSFYGRTEMPVDLATEETLRDLSDVIAGILNGDAPRFPGIDWDSARNRFLADMDFYHRYGHMLIGDGPYVFTEFNAPDMVYRLEKFKGKREVLGKSLPAEGTPETMVCYGSQNPYRALQEVLNGNFDLFMDPLPQKYLRDLDWYAKEGRLKLYPRAKDRYGLVLNPLHNGSAPLIIQDGRAYFNPFAVREVRLALNYLINRSHLSEEIPWSVPAFDNLGPVHPAEENMMPVYGLFNLTPEGNPSYGMVLFERGMEKAREELAKENHTLEIVNGTWYFDGEPVEITIVVDVTPRYNPGDESLWLGRYIAKTLEELGFRVRTEEWDISHAYHMIHKKGTLWHAYVIRFWGTTPHWTSKPVFEPGAFLDITTNVTLADFLNFLIEPGDGTSEGNGGE